MCLQARHFCVVVRQILGQQRQVEGDTRLRGALSVPRFNSRGWQGWLLPRFQRRLDEECAPSSERARSTTRHGKSQEPKRVLLQLASVKSQRRSLYPHLRHKTEGMAGLASTSEAGFN